LPERLHDLQVVPAVVVAVLGWEEAAGHAVHPLLPDRRFITGIVYVGS
jgi:hypothetical protein